MSDQLAEIIDDLRAEQAAFHALLIGLGPDGWDRATPAAGWLVRHQVAHIAFFDDLGADCIAGDDTRLREIRRRVASHPADDVSTDLLTPLLALAPADLLVTARTNAARVSAALAGTPAATRVPWAAGPMALASFASARLMETWAHGLDVQAALERPRPDTARLRHVCRIGYRALPYAFVRAERTMPGDLSELRLDVTGPDGELWSFGPSSATQSITGPAGEWARVAVQRMPAHDAHGLRANGPLAVQALDVARAFA